MHRFAVSILRRYVFKGVIKNDNESNLVAAADVLIPDVIEKVRMGVCPFCGRRFEKVANHLQYKSKCGSVFRVLLNAVALYADAAKHFAGKSKWSEKRYWYCRVCYARFGSSYEAYRHVVENHMDVLENWLQLISGPMVSWESQQTLTVEDASLL